MKTLEEKNEVMTLWTKRETAAYYRVSERTIDRWLSDHVIPVAARIVIGGAVRFRSQVLINSVNPPLNQD